MYERTRHTLHEMLSGTRAQRLDALVSLALVLAVLLIVTNILGILGAIFGIIGRFQAQILLFVFGALIAYLILPLVELIQRAIRIRFAAIASAYLLIFLAFIVLGVLLLNPFISQAESLVTNLRNPAAASLLRLQTVRTETADLERTVQDQQRLLSGGTAVSLQSLQQTQAAIFTLQRALTNLTTGSPPRGQIQIPPSYVAPIRTPLNQLAVAYETATHASGSAERQAVDTGLAAAKALLSAATNAYDTAVATPVLLLNAQAWLDGHSVNVNLHDQFGSALQQLSKDLSSVLNNVLGIALQTGNLLLNLVLILIISVYFVADGARFLHWCVRLAPLSARPRMRYFLRSLNHTFGMYLRTLFLLAALAGAMDSLGAVVFGVPYPIVIFFSSSILSLIPIIGSIILYVPPMIIALLFTSFPTPLFYLFWLLIGEQLVTNVIGPRLTGRNVGIHPLEAMAATLLGYPIAGLIGALLAVPLLSFLHVVVRQIRHSAERTPEELEETPPMGQQGPAAASAPAATPPA